MGLYDLYFALIPHGFLEWSCFILTAQYSVESLDYIFNSFCVPSVFFKVFRKFIYLIWYNFVFCFLYSLESVCLLNKIRFLSQFFLFLFFWFCTLHIFAFAIPKFLVCNVVQLLEIFLLMNIKKTVMLLLIFGICFIIDGRWTVFTGICFFFKFFFLIPVSWCF